MKYVEKFKKCIWPMFSISFTWILFAPLEICANNTADVPYTVMNLLPVMLVAFVTVPILCALIISLSPNPLFETILYLLFGVMIATYVQASFLNGQLTQLDGSEQAWMSDMGFKIFNALIWGIIILLSFVLKQLLKGNWKTVVTFVSVLLMAMQGSGLMVTILEAEKPITTNYYIPADSAYKLAEEDNIVVFVVDTYSMKLLDAAMSDDPTTLNPFKDFTLYRNCSQVYQATVPALLSLVTGQHVDMTQDNRSDMFEAAWTNDYTASFYQTLKDMNYSMNIFTKPNFICDNYTGQYVMRFFDNVRCSNVAPTINAKSALKNYLLLSASRNMPYIAKDILPLDLVNIDQTYTISLSDASNTIKTYREWYFSAEDIASIHIEKGVKKRLSIYHGYGAHLPNHLDANGIYDKNVDTTDGQVGRGNLKLIADFIQRMQELDVYEESTIIVTADHGHTQREDRTTLFMFKAPNTTQNEILYSDAPIRNNDTLATIAGVLGMDAAIYGKPAYEYQAGEERARTVFFNAKSDEFPANGTLPNAMREYQLMDHASEYKKYGEHFVQIFPINDYFYD